MKLEIDIPEEMLESEILDAIISVDTDNKIIRKVHIEPRANDNINDVLDDVKAEIKEMVTFENVDDLVNVTRILDKHKRGRSQN